MEKQRYGILNSQFSILNLSIGIVGGGITGLVAAYRLKQRGTPVVLYEASTRVGGPMHTIRRDGFLAESGPNTMLETSELTSLIRDLGIESHKIYASDSAKKRFIVCNGKLLPVPLSPAPGPQGAPGPSVGSRASGP